MQLLTNTVLVSCTIDGTNFLNYGKSNFILKRRHIMCNNKSCCVDTVIISSITPPAIVGANYVLTTTYNFSNAVDGDKFLIRLPFVIPAQVILGSVIVVGTGTPIAITLETPCIPENLLSDQLTGLESLCCVFAKASARMRIIKAFNTCGCECSLRKSAGIATIDIDLLNSKAVK